MKTVRLYTLFIIIGLICSSAVKAEGSSTPVLNNTGGTYTLVEKYDDIEDGGVYLVTRVKGGILYAMSTANTADNGYFAAVELKSAGTIAYNSAKYEYEYPASVSVSDVNSISPSSLPYEYVFVKDGDGWRIKDINNKYLLNNRPNNPTLSLTEESNEGTLFTIDSKSFNYLTYLSNQSANLYFDNTKLYFSFTSGGSKIALYKKVTSGTPDDTSTKASFSMSTVGYATLYYGEKDVTLPTGLCASTYTLKTINDRMYLSPSHTYNAGDKIPAGVGVVVRGSEGNYEISLTEPDANLEKYANVLKGTDTEETVTDENSLFYMLSLNKDNDINSVGFYYGSDNGAAFVNGAHKAYLPVPVSAGAKPLSILFYDNEEGNATGLDLHGLNESVKDVKYDVLGRRVSSGVNSIQIIKGKKVVTR